MPNFNDLVEAIAGNEKFIRRKLVIEKAAAKKHLGVTEDNSVSESEVRKMLTQASVLALSDQESLRLLAQRVCALLFEIAAQNNLSIAYAIQLLYSRLGNFPAISNCKIFKQENILDELTASSTSFDFDPEIIANLLLEKDTAEFKVQAESQPIYLNDEQHKLVLKLQEKKLISFSAPTSFGKSFIVRNFIAKMFAESHIRRCLVLVPSKSLIDGFFDDFLELKNSYNLPFSIRTHVRSVEDIPENCVFVLTQERLSFLLTKHPEIVRSFELIYCDEAHSISRGYRGFLLRKVLMQCIEICHDTTKYVFTSPLIKNPEFYKEKLFPNLPNIDSFHEVINFAPVERMLFLVESLEDKYKYHLYSPTQSGEDQYQFIKEEDFTLQALEEDLNIKKNIQIVLNTATKGGSILYTTGKANAHRYAYHLANALPERQGLGEDRIRDLDSYINTHFHRGFGLISLIKKGIGIHHGAMPIGLRREMVKIFEVGHLSYLVCTYTLIEGVNLPSRNIFLF